MSDTTISPENTEEAPNERRALLRKLAIGGAGAAVGAVVLGKTAAQRPPTAAPILAAQVNSSTAPDTVLTHATPALAATAPAGPSSFSVSDAAPALVDAPYPANVGGYGNAEVIHGVHGSTGVACRFRCRRGQPCSGSGRCNRSGADRAGHRIPERRAHAVARRLRHRYDARQARGR